MKQANIKPVTLANRKPYSKSLHKKVCLSSDNLDKPPAKKQKTVIKNSIPQCDQEHLDDCSKVAQYGERIHQHLCSTAGQCPSNRHYIQMNQPNFSAAMRCILIDWMFQVQHQFVMQPQCIHMSVNLFDRFMSSFRVIEKDEIQLIGATCQYIVAKTEEVYPKQANEFVWLSDSAFNEQTLFATERQILNELEWQVYVPNALCFLKRFALVLKIQESQDVFKLANLILDTTLLNYHFISTPMPLLAAGSLYLALFHCKSTNLADQMEVLEKYSECQVEHFQEMARSIYKALGGVLEKYDGVLMYYSKNPNVVVTNFVERFRNNHPGES